MRKIIFLLSALFLFCCNSNIHQEIQTYKVKRGEFFINVVETGELKATKSTMITAPTIHWRFGDLKITKIIDDGTEVAKGDTLVLFDQAEVQKAVIDAKAELDIARAEYEKTKADQDSKIEELEADLKMTEISYQISKLELEQATYEADIRKKEIELQLEQAEISLKKAAEEIENQKKIHAEELYKIKLRIDQLKNNLNDANETISRLTITAPNDGLVIIEKSWMSGNKWQVGDQPYSGWPLMSLPDLNELMAATQINEVDISKIRLDQRVNIKLDATSDTTFTGKVTDIAVLAQEKDKKSKVKVFPVEIIIDGTHKLLLPGMTVSCDIIVDKIDSVLSIPLEGLFKEDHRQFVYIAKGNSYQERQVEIGMENNDYVIIKEGLKEGDIISLVNPRTEKDKKEKS